MHAQTYLAETAVIAAKLLSQEIEALAQELVSLRFRAGRLFFFGIGGSAANCSHAVNDFRKLCQIDAYTPTDNVAELTARANDDGWPTIFSGWLQNTTPNDALFILSVGGGSDGVSVALVEGIKEAKKRGMKVFGIVGRDGGYTAKYGDCVIVIPTVNEKRVTPHTEGWQSVILHCLVSHPDLQRNSTKW